MDENFRSASDADGQPLAGSSTFRDGPPTPGNARRVILVARDETDLWRYLAEHYGQIEGLQVLLDRRRGERRRQDRAYMPERRIAERRQPRSSEKDLRRHPCVVIIQQ